MNPTSYCVGIPIAARLGETLRVLGAQRGRKIGKNFIKKSNEGLRFNIVGVEGILILSVVNGTGYSKQRWGNIVSVRS